MKKLVIGLLLIFGTTSMAEMTPQSQSIFSKSKKLDQEGVELYSTNSEMKIFKKLGLGFMMGGSTGLVGLNAEVNLDSTEAVFIGLGAGPSYGTFSFGWKHNFEGQYLSPYTKLGYSKWFNSSGSNATESDILKSIFTYEELKSGRFNADFAVGGIGLEYNQLEGELSGVNLFAEVLLLDEISKSTFIPTGGVGIIYYY